MTRYYFHMSNGGELVTDDFGAEFAREEDAHAHAVRVGAELASNNPTQSIDGWRLIIMDDTGRVVSSVLLPVDD